MNDEIKDALGLLLAGDVDGAEQKLRALASHELSLVVDVAEDLSLRAERIEQERRSREP